MVKIVKSKPSFPNGVPGLRMKFPMWGTVQSVDQSQLKGLYRGDFLYFKYRAKESNVDKKINNNPLIIFEGIDANGNIIGTNLMFFNMFIDPKTSKKEVNTRYINTVMDVMRSVHWDDIYISGKRKAYLPFMRHNLINMFGRNVGSDMQRFWRVYKPNEITHLSNITLDSALEILSETNPTYRKTTNSIK